MKIPDTVDVIAHLKAAVAARSWDRVRDLLTVLEDDHGDVIFRGDVLDQCDLVRNLNAKIMRVAAAIREGRIVAGCGDPDCTGCPSCSEPVQVAAKPTLTFPDGGYLELDSVPHGGQPVLYWVGPWMAVPGTLKP